MLLCVFFFKQKTAYEMRISDWSSDVCFSDLKPEAPPKPVPTEAQQQAQARAVAKNSGLLAMTDQLAELRDQSLHGLDTNRSLSSDRIAAQAGTGAPGGSRDGFTASAASEIGRAACRERVCQDVSIPVGGVSLKKHNKH